MEFQMVVLPGTTGTERMVQFTQFMNGENTIVQFPWVHLNRVFKLFSQTKASIKQANYAVNEHRRKTKAEENRSRSGPQHKSGTATGATNRNYTLSKTAQRSGYCYESEFRTKSKLIPKKN
jgi:hypothetical protein